MSSKIARDGWDLISAEERNAAHPETFQIPAREIRESLVPGEAAKLLFDIETRKEGRVVDRGVDRMWVIVKSREEGGYIGVLDSNPRAAENLHLHEGDSITFRPEHIADIGAPARDYVMKKYGAAFFEYAMILADMLRQPGRQWRGKRGACDADIALLAAKARTELPTEYLELLRFSNGGEGPLALPPLWFQLYSVSDCIELCHSGWVLKEFPDFMFFGSNGGGESIAFDLRGNKPWPIVAVDQVAGVSSAMQIAANMADFVRAIGAESSDATPGQ